MAASDPPTANPDVAPASTTARYLVLGSICIVLFLYSMQISMPAVALPTIQEDLESSLRWVGWVMTIYTLGIAIAMPVAGKLSDDVGRRKVLFIGLIAFSASSLLCALAPSIPMLIAGRAIQGVSAGSLMPSAYGIVSDIFVASRAQAIGFLSSVPAIGAVIGPNIGGVSVDVLSWRYIFLINLPLALVALVILGVLVKRDMPRDARALDVPGTVLLAAALTGLLYALTELGRTSGPPNMVAVTVASVVATTAGVLFIVRETHVKEPVLDMELVVSGQFGYVNLLNFLYGVSTFGMSTFVPLYAQAAYGMSPSESGLVLTGRAAAISLGAVGASMVLPWSGYRRPMVAGILIVAGALVVLALGVHEPSFLGLTASNLVYLSVVMIVIGVGHGITGPASNNAALDLAPERIASLSGLRGMFRFIGGAIGIAIVIMVASRSGNTGEALEWAFIGLAVMTVATALLVTQVPERVPQTAQFVSASSAASGGP